MKLNYAVFMDHHVLASTLKHFLRVSLLYIGHNNFDINVAFMISFLSFEYLLYL